MTGVLLLLAVPGCAAPDPVEVPRGLVLRIVDTGGLITRGAEYKVPAVSLFGDGRLIQVSGQELVQHRLTGRGVQKVMRAALAAGLDRPADLGHPKGIVDAPVTIYTFVTARGRFETVVVAPQEAGDTAGQSRVRQALSTLRKVLRDVDSWRGAEVAGGREGVPGCVEGLGDADVAWEVVRPLLPGETGCAAFRRP
jgi:hypothetical protein